MGTGVLGPLATNPIFVEAPFFTVPFQFLLLTVTALPDWVAFPFQRFCSFWLPEGKVQRSFQPLYEAGPLLVILTSTLNPPVHDSCTT